MSDYEDILRLPHHVSRRHPQMSMHSRAAQFSPFAALTGYGAAIRETARQTNRRIDLSEDEQEEISRRLRALAAGEPSEAVFVYFVPDARKEGGEYVSCRAGVKRIDELTRQVLLTDGREIPIGDLMEIDSITFRGQERP